MLDERNKFEKEINADIDQLEFNLKHLDEKLSLLEQTEKLDFTSHSEFVDYLVAQFQVGNIQIKLLLNVKCQLC